MQTHLHVLEPSYVANDTVVHRNMQKTSSHGEDFVGGTQHLRIGEDSAQEEPAEEGEVQSASRCFMRALPMVQH